MALSLKFSDEESDLLLNLLSQSDNERVVQLRRGIERERARGGGGRVVLEFGQSGRQAESVAQSEVAEADAVRERWAVLSQYSWSESETGVDLRIPVVPGAQCRLCDLTTRTVTVEVRGAEEEGAGATGSVVGRRLVLGYTAGDVVTDKCTVRLVKGGTLAKVHLAKADRGWLWTKLTTTPPAAAPDGQPQQSIRSALADLYRTSDDETKRSMNRAFSLAHTASPTDLFGQKQLDEWEAAGV